MKIVKRWNRKIILNICLEIGILASLFVISWLFQRESIHIITEKFTDSTRQMFVTFYQELNTEDGQLIGQTIVGYLISYTIIPMYLLLHIFMWIGKANKSEKKFKLFKRSKQTEILS